MPSACQSSTEAPDVSCVGKAEGNIARGKRLASTQLQPHIKNGQVGPKFCTHHFGHVKRAQRLHQPLSLGSEEWLCSSVRRSCSSLASSSKRPGQILGVQRLQVSLQRKLAEKWSRSVGDFWTYWKRTLTVICSAMLSSGITRVAL